MVLLMLCSVVSVEWFLIYTYCAICGLLSVMYGSMVFLLFWLILM